ncbi:MAG: PIN domain-containing protein [Chloroflexi bacterium]|nr:PIN domain-containing protein [Chloroflexota bacterium]MBU1662092.1 PIN domain-containing protein [Chloroflexota bacterium]
MPGIIAWTVLLEVTYISRQERGEAEAEYRYAAIKELPADIIWEMDEPTLLTAARWKANYHISFTDAIIAAYTLRQGATLLHKDPEFEALEGQLAVEALPYKTTS